MLRPQIMKQEVTGRFGFNENHYQLYIGRGIQSLSSTSRRTVTSYIGELGHTFLQHQKTCILHINYKVFASS